VCVEFAWVAHAEREREREREREKERETERQRERERKRERETVRQRDALLLLGQQVGLVEQQHIELGWINFLDVALEIHAAEEERVARIDNLNHQVAEERDSESERGR
jgi:hypothetical protein